MLAQPYMSPNLTWVIRVSDIFKLRQHYLTSTPTLYILLALLYLRLNTI